MNDLKMERVKSVMKVVENWQFFLAGLEKMNKITKPDMQVEPEMFFRVLCDTVSRGPEKGHLLIAKVDEKPVGFSVTFDNSTCYRKQKTALVYGAYSLTPFKGMSKVVWKHIQAWAKANGYDEMQAFSPRINGSGFYLFEDCFGFTRQMVLFTKQI